MYDRLEMNAKGGGGGKGAVSFRREKFVPKGGPNGGDGGRGGHVILVADPQLSTLRPVAKRRHLRAEDGQHGKGSGMHGAHGRDLVVAVPPGTEVLRQEAGGGLVPLADLATPGARVVVARGGLGGWGNARFATSTYQAPHIAQRGQPGEEVRLVLELKLLADVGIVGLPNAGKSTLLAHLSAARPAIGDFPFTTLEPVLGVVEVGYRAFVMADLPGLIEGAHRGAGLGHEFLRHVERTRLLVHLLDGSRPDPDRDREGIDRELTLHGHELTAKPQVVAVNKLDLPEVRARREELGRRLGDASPLFISAATGEGTAELLRRILELLPAEEAPAMAGVAPLPREAAPPRFQVSRDGEVLRVRGPRVEALAQMMDWQNTEERQAMLRLLGRMGVDRALRRAGARAGSRVLLGDVEVAWEEPP